MSTQRVTKYGKETWQDQELDAVRRKCCLCLRCTKFQPGEPDNCAMAEVLFALCRTKGMAVGVSRCAEFEEHV